MDPAASPSRAGRNLRPLRRVLLAAVAGAAWLTLSSTAAQADDACSFHGPADDAGETSAATGCADAGNFPVTTLDGAQVALDAVPAPTWAAGAVPALPTSAPDGDAAYPADEPVADEPPDAAQAAVDPAAPGPDTRPPATDPAPPAFDPAAPDTPLPAPDSTPPAAGPVADPAAPIGDPAVPDPAVPVVDPAVPVVVPEPAVPEPAVPDPAVPEPAVPEPAVPEPAVPDPPFPNPPSPTRLHRFPVTPLHRCPAIRRLFFRMTLLPSFLAMPQQTCRQQTPPRQPTAARQRPRNRRLPLAFSRPALRQPLQRQPQQRHPVLRRPARSEQMLPPVPKSFMPDSCGRVGRASPRGCRRRTSATPCRHARTAGRARCTQPKSLARRHRPARTRRAPDRSGLGVRQRALGQRARRNGRVGALPALHRARKRGRPYRRSAPT